MHFFLVEGGFCSLVVGSKTSQKLYRIGSVGAVETHSPAVRALQASMLVLDGPEFACLPRLLHKIVYIYA